MTDWRSDLSTGIERLSDVPEAVKILKIAEELGETSEAYIGARGLNPRKGFTHSDNDVADELADCAIAALVAMSAFVDDPVTQFTERLAVVVDRLPASATGDSGAVQDSVSVPSGDSVTLIERADAVSSAITFEPTPEKLEDAVNWILEAAVVLELRESGNKDLESASADVAEELQSLAFRLSAFAAGYGPEFRRPEMSRSEAVAIRKLIASATRGSASLRNPVPVESDRQSSESRGLGSASALEVEAAGEGLQDVIDALECNCIEGGTNEPEHCSYCRCVATVKRLASATKPEASPSPENRFGETATDDQAAVPLVASTGAESPRTTPAVSPKIEDGAAIRPRAEAGERTRFTHPGEFVYLGGVWYDLAELPSSEALRKTYQEAHESGWDAGQASIWDEFVCSVCGWNHDRDESVMCEGADVTTFSEFVDKVRDSAQTPLASPKPESSRPVGTSEYHLSGCTLPRSHAGYCCSGDDLCVADEHSATCARSRPVSTDEEEGQ